MQNLYSPEADEQLGIQPNDTGRVISLEHFWRVLMRRKFIVIGVTLLIVAGSLLYVSLAKRLYAGSALLDISQQNSQSSLSGLLESSINDEQSLRMQTEQKIMQSSTVLLQVADQLNLIHRPEFAFLKAGSSPDVAHLTALQKADLAGSLRHDTTLSTVPGTTIVSVTYTTTNPELARDVPNMLVECPAFLYQLGTIETGIERSLRWHEARSIRQSRL